MVAILNLSPHFLRRAVAKTARSASGTWPRALSSRALCPRRSRAKEHKATWRENLGFFRDYVQTVPYMGYRFKA